MTILLVISGIQFQNDEGAKNRLNSFIESYSKEGYRVSVLLFYPIKSIRYTFSKSKYLHPKAKWHLLPMLPLSLTLTVTRISRLISQFYLAIFSRVHRFSIIQLEGSGIEAQWCPKYSKVIVDFHGDAVSESKYRKKKSDNWLSNWFIHEQKKSIRNADYIISVSQNLKQVIEDNTGLSIKKYSIISCGVNLNRFSSTETAKLNFDTENRIMIGYIGGMQKWQNIDAIIDLAIKLYKNNPQVFLVLFTNDELPVEAQSKLKLLGSDNFCVKGLKFQEVGHHLRILDAGFLIREDLPLNIVSSPTKIAEYIASGVPVICTKFSGDYKRSIQHMKEGFVLNDVYPSDQEIGALSKFLNQVKMNRKDYSTYCMEAAKLRSWDSEFQNFIKQINE